MYLIDKAVFIRYQHNANATHKKMYWVKSEFNSAAFIASPILTRVFYWAILYFIEIINYAVSLTAEKFFHGVSTSSSRRSLIFNYKTGVFNAVPLTAQLKASTATPRYEASTGSRNFFHHCNSLRNHFNYFSGL